MEKPPTNACVPRAHFGPTGRQLSVHRSTRSSRTRIGQINRSEADPQRSSGVSVEAHHSVGTVVFARAIVRSSLAPANFPLWKVDQEIDGVVQPAVFDRSRYDVGLLVFVHHLPASRVFLPLVPRPVGLAL